MLRQYERVVRNILACFVMFGASYLGLVPCVHAHHGSSLSQIGNTSMRSRAATVGEAVPPPSLELSLTYDGMYFSRELYKSQRYDKGDFGTILVQRLLPTARLTLASSTQLSLTVPVGIVAISPHEGSSTTRAGFGDTRLDIGQDLSGLWSNAGPVSVAVHTGMLAPTGKYQPDSSLSVTDIVPGSSGALNLVTYNTRASLGADAWSWGVGADVLLRVHQRLKLDVRLDVMHPLTRTQDDILWGLDVNAFAAAYVEPVLSVLSLFAGVDDHWHQRDSIPVVDETTLITRHERVGGRHEISIVAGASVRVATALECNVRAHLPVFQHVGGVQLVETFAINTGCAVMLGL
jgi:hypothetical protein